MSRLVLDSEAIAQLAAAGMTGAGVSAPGEPKPKKGDTVARPAISQHLLAALNQARQRGMMPSTTAAVLSEQYRDHHGARLDAFLSRNPHIEIVDTDREVARSVGRLLKAAGSGSADHVDATVVVAAIRTAGASVVVTSDEGDIRRLSGASGKAVTVVGL